MRAGQNTHYLPLPLHYPHLHYRSYYRLPGVSTVAGSGRLLERAAPRGQVGVLPSGYGAGSGCEG